MKELLKKEQTKFGIVLLILVGICFGSIVLGGDDWIWNYAYEFDELEKFRMPNGRYLSNILTYLMVRYVPIRFVLYIPILLTLIWLLCRGMQYTSNVVMWSGLMLFCLMPGDVWGENVMWVSAFPVYSLPLVSVLL